MMSVNDLKTPFFLLKENLLEENIGGFRKALDELWPNSDIAYSVKTNALPYLLKWMDKNGVLAEVVSDEEYELAELCGFDKKNIVFNGPIKSPEKILDASKGGSIVNIDSVRESEMISKGKLENPHRIGIRVNVNPEIFSKSDVGYQEDGFRFGYSDESGELSKTIEAYYHAYGDKKFGLHMHVNSVTRALDVYRAIAQYAAKIIKKYQITPSFIDMGGGYFGGVPGKPTPEQYISVIKEELIDCVDPKVTRLIIEPGSAAVGSTMELHTSVLDVKDTAHARIVTTDGSRIHIDPLWLKKGYLYDLVTEGQNIDRQVICGYTCMDHDRLMVIENKPELHIGDRIIYKKVGNYTVTFGGPFIQPFPNVYFEDKDGIHLIRERMSINEYYRMETVR